MGRSSIPRTDPRPDPSPRRWAARGPWRWIGAIGLASLVLAAAVVALARSPLLRVREVRVEGLTHGSPARIVRLSGLSEGDPLVGLDVGAVRARVERDPWVARAEIDVDLPSTVTIRVTERVPIAVVDLGSGPVLVDAQGAAIARGAGAGLPEIVLAPAWVERLRAGDPQGPGPSVSAVARALGALSRAALERVVQARFSPGSGLELVLREGVRVIYGPPRELEAKAEALARVLRWAEETGARLRSINVVAPSVPAVDLVG